MTELLLKLNLQYFSDEPPADPDPSPEPGSTVTEPPVKTFTQSEVNEIIKERSARWKKQNEKYSDYDEMKSKLEGYEAAAEERRQADLTEIEKAQEQAKLAEEKSQELQAQLEASQKARTADFISAEFHKAASSAGIKYTDDAKTLVQEQLHALKITDDNKVDGLDELVKGLVESKPYLLDKTKTDRDIGQPGNPKNPVVDKTREQVLADVGKQMRSGRVQDVANFISAQRQFRK